jgi:hypothetical protein
MITIALLAHPVRRVAGSRKPDALARMLAAMARALRVLHEANLHSVSTRLSRFPSVPIFIVYDVLDVIGARRRVN